MSSMYIYVTLLNIILNLRISHPCTLLPQPVALFQPPKCRVAHNHAQNFAILRYYLTGNGWT